MSNFILLLVCLIAGISLRWVKRLPKATPQVLNHFVLFISLPSLVLNQFHGIELSPSAFIPALMPWVLFLVGWGTVHLGAQVFRWDQKTQGTLILMSGLGNTAFIGFPMLEALYGDEAVSTGVLVDQLGTFLIFSTLALAVGSLYSGKKVSGRSMFSKILVFPPIYALALAILLKPFEFPPLLTEVLHRLGSTISPLALVSVGFQLKLKRETLIRYTYPLSYGLIFKLIIAPSLFSLLAMCFFSLSSLEIKAILAESAMAPMISASLIVAEFDLDSELSHLMLGLGIPISFMTVPLWNWIWY
jgi:malate permease and related proteins